MTHFAKTVGALLVTVAAGAWGPSTTAFAGELRSQEYWVRIPATSQSCEVEAALLAERFQKSVNVASVEKECLGVIDVQFDGVPTQLYSILVTYSSERPVVPYSALLGGVVNYNSRSVNQGEYTTYGDCVADLVDQSANYSVQTGLTPVAAYCSPSRAGLEHRYVLQIDGFGSPKRQLQILHQNVGNGDASLTAAFRSLVASQGAAIVRTVRDAILYYQEQSVAVRQHRFGFFSDVAQCEIQRQTVADLFKSTGSKTVPIVACQAEESAGGALWLQGAADGYAYLDGRESSVRYYTFGECMQDRARAIRKGALGAICRPHLFDSSVFVMDVYQ
jgi:hypothetical protein